MIRQPAVANRFYPGSRSALSQTIAELTPSTSSGPNKKKAIAAISPHAGYIYSGAVAAETLSSIHIPKTVVILGLNHHGQGAAVSLSRSTWAMPLGHVTVDEQVADNLLQAGSPVVHDELAHRYEHSVEVQIPFLQVLQPELQIVPIVLSHISYLMCEEVAATLAAAMQTAAKDILIVASSDMTHYESREVATAKDAEALDHIKRLNPRGLYDTVHCKRISMCGVVPVTIALIAAKSLGAAQATVIRYTDSGEVSGDIEQVVGYAGVVIS
jgi:AmmeMemoRadiSam system protein B